MSFYWGTETINIELLMRSADYFPLFLSRWCGNGVGIPTPPLIVTVLGFLVSLGCTLLFRRSFASSAFYKARLVNRNYLNLFLLWNVFLSLENGIDKFCWV